jgi:hypothetical protein
MGLIGFDDTGFTGRIGPQHSNGAIAFIEGRQYQIATHLHGV